MNYLDDPQVRKALIDKAGENAIAVLQLLRQNLKDEEIAERLGVKVSDVRVALNKLAELGIVYYKRKRDKETGWWQYEWLVDAKKFKSWIDREFNKKYDDLIRRVQEEELYYCPSCGISHTFSFDEAADLFFKCPVCGEGLEVLDEETVLAYKKKRK